MSYARFGLMIITSTLVMLVLMYLNTFSLDHVSSAKREPGWMAVLMLAFMWSMYRDKHRNVAIAASSAVPRRSGSYAARLASTMLHT
jgi:hypothetical protein